MGPFRAIECLQGLSLWWGRPAPQEDAQLYDPACYLPRAEMDFVQHWVGRWEGRPRGSLSSPGALAVVPLCVRGQSPFHSSGLEVFWVLEILMFATNTFSQSHRENLCIHISGFLSSALWTCWAPRVPVSGFWRLGTPTKRSVVPWVLYFRNIYGRKVSSTLLLASLGP